MYLSRLSIENYRSFGEGPDGLSIELNPGLTAIVGENDTGKTTVIDAIRLALTTRDQEYYRVDETDFHQPKGGGSRATEIRIRCTFEDLSVADKGAFAEHLTYQDVDGKMSAIFILNWKAVLSSTASGARRFTLVETCSGKEADGPTIDQRTRALRKRDNVFRQKGTGTPVHVRLGSIHSVKGETHTAALLCETFYRAHHLKSLKSWLLGKKSGGLGENQTTQARLKQHYVAMTRPTHLFCLALRRDCLSDGEIDQLKSRWRVGLVGSTAVSWLS